VAGSRTQAKGSGDYTREALSEWGRAMRYGARAVAELRQERKENGGPLLERLNPAKTEKGGRLGDAADVALSRFGKPGKALSKLSLGSRIVERIHGGSERADRQTPDPSGSNGRTTVPIQESIDVAVPIRTVYALATRYEEYPEILDRAVSAKEIDDSHVTFIAKVHGRERELLVEIVEELPDQRLDWECTEGLEHSGVISFHELAPRLTHVELTVELEPDGLLDRLARTTHLTERAIRTELQRFKAHAELSEEGAEAYEAAATGDAADNQPEHQDDVESAESADQGDVEDEVEPEEEEELEDEADFEAEEELEPDETLEAEEDVEDDEELAEDGELEAEEDLDADEDLEEEDFEEEEEPEAEEGLEDDEYFEEDEDLEEEELEPAR
jgi:uncharacterized membrane protein